MNLRRHIDGSGGRHGRRLLALWLGILLALPLSADDGSPLGGVFEVGSASVVNRQGVWELSAHVRYPLNERIRSALRDGVTLTFDLEVAITRHRRLWFDAEIIDLDLRRDLSYHVVSDRYLVSSHASRDIETFPSIEAALAYLGDIADWPIVVDSQLAGDGPWQVSVRAGVRRGRMPDALRALVFWSDAWHRTSDWYRWTLPR
jgi:hypothetical protein